MHHEVRKNYALQMALEVMLESTFTPRVASSLERNTSCIPSYDMEPVLFHHFSQGPQVTVVVDRQVKTNLAGIEGRSTAL